MEVDLDSDFEGAECLLRFSIASSPKRRKVADNPPRPTENPFNHEVANSSIAPASRTAPVDRQNGFPSGLIDAEAHETIETPSAPSRTSTRKRRDSLKAQANMDTMHVGHNEQKLDVHTLRLACLQHDKAKDDALLRHFLYQNGFPERLVKSYIYQMTATELTVFLNESGLSKRLQVMIRDELDSLRQVSAKEVTFNLLRSGTLVLVDLVKGFKDSCPLFTHLMDIIVARRRSQGSKPESQRMNDPDYFVVMSILQNIISQSHVELQRFIGLWGLCNGWTREMFILMNNLHFSVSLNTVLKDLRHFGNDLIWRKEFFARILQSKTSSEPIAIMPVLDNTDVYYSRSSQRAGQDNSGYVHVTTMSFVKVNKSIPSADQLSLLYPGRALRRELGFSPKQWETVMPSFEDRRYVDVALASAIVEKILLSHPELSGVGNHLKLPFSKPPEIRNEFVVGCILPQDQSRPSEMIQILKFINSLGSDAPTGVVLEKIVHADQGGAAVARTAVAANEKQGHQAGHDSADFLEDWIPSAADGHLVLNMLPMIWETGFTLPAGIGAAIRKTNRKNVTELYQIPPPAVAFQPKSAPVPPLPDTVDYTRVTRSQTSSQRRIDEMIEDDDNRIPDNEFLWRHATIESDIDDDIVDFAFIATPEPDSDFDPDQASSLPKEKRPASKKNESELKKRKGKFPAENSQVNLDFLQDYTSAAVLSAWKFYIGSENLRDESQTWSPDQLHQNVSQFLLNFIADRPTEWESNPETAALRQLIRLCLILSVLEDCIHRGADADIVIIWRRLMFAFKAMNKLHYFEESFRLQCAISFALSDRQAWILENCRSVACRQSLWCRSTDFAQENTVKVAKKLLVPALARAEDKEAACAEWGKMLPVYFDMRTGIHHLLTEMGINSAAQQRHSRPSSTDDIVRIMELFTLENVWTQKASSLEYKYSGRYRELDRRGKELAEPFIYSWLNEGKQVMNMQLISEKDTLVAEEL